MDNKKWFKEAKFGMMIHWGIYSLLGGEYNGNHPDVHNQNDNGADHVDNHHKGHDLLGDGGNALQTAHHNQTDQNQNGNAGYPGGQTEHRFQIARNGVDLGHVADAEGG